MASRSIILLLLACSAKEILSAPSGCIESCTSFHKFYQTSGGYQDHAGVQNLDFSRPGNWTEHNQYRTDGGQGKVHEERGQYEEGPKRVRFYKKNYTASFSSGNANSGLSSLDQQNVNRFGTLRIPDTQQILGTQQAYNQMGGSDVITQQHNYDRVHSQQQTTSRRTQGHQSERLEDFGEYSGNTQVAQGTYGSDSTQGVYHSGSQPTNWSKVDSYKTDGGRGQVYEEQGQYHSGPKQVRYYRRNYTSSYSSGGVPETSSTGVHDIHREIEKLQHQIGREIQQISGTASTFSNVDTTNHMNRGDVTSTATETQRHQHEHESLSSSALHQSANHGMVGTTMGATEYLPYRAPVQNVYKSEKHSSYENQERYVRPVAPITDSTQVLINGNSQYNQHLVEMSEAQRAMQGMRQQMSAAEVQRLVEAQRLSSMQDNGYVQRLSTNSGTPGQVGHYKEHWSAASHTKEGTIPLSSDTRHLSEISGQYNTNRHTDQRYQSLHGESSGYQNQYRQNSYNSAYTAGGSSSATHNVDHFGHTADCDDTTHQNYHQQSQYHRNYKRSAKYDESRDMQQQQEADSLTQQTLGKIEFGQQTEQSQRPQKLTFGTDDDDDLNQQTQDLTQQANVGIDDFSQSTSGTLEFGHGHGQHSLKPNDKGNLEDLTQQTHEDTQQVAEFPQQITGTLEFGRQNRRPHQFQKPMPDNHHLGDFTQQRDFQQHTNGKLEFGQDSQQQTMGHLEMAQQTQNSRRPTTGNQNLEDLSQQTEDLTQQNENLSDHSKVIGQLEFGHQSQHHQHHQHHQQQQWQRHHHNQHHQQRWQQTVHNQNLDDFKQDEDLTQQTGGFDDFTQTSGKLEFGQQSQHSKPDSINRYPQDSTQRTEDLSQQTGNVDDFTQTSGKVDFGSWKPNYYPRQPAQQNGHHMQPVDPFDDYTQQIRRLALQRQFEIEQYMSQKHESEQQTSGKLEFPQQTVASLILGHHTQQTGNHELTTSAIDAQDKEDFTQQNQDMTQQVGKLEFASQTQKPTKPTTIEYPTHLTQKPEDISQQTHGSTNDNVQGTLEFGQQTAGEKYEDLFQHGRRPEWHQSFQEPTTWQKEDLTQQSVQNPFSTIPSSNDKNANYKQEFEPVDTESQSTQQASKVIPLETDLELGTSQSSQQTAPKPAEKPKPRPRYPTRGPQQRYPHWDTDSSNNNKAENPHFNTVDISVPTVHDALSQVKPVADMDTIRGEKIRGDQNLETTTSKDVLKDLNQQSQITVFDIDKDEDTPKDSNKQSQMSAFDTDRGSADQVNWLHKSNDATVGLQWHYTYHPSDLTNSEPVQNSYYPSLNHNSNMRQKQMTDQFTQQSSQHEQDSDDLQQQSSHFDFGPQETQNKQPIEDINQQVTNTHKPHSQYNQLNQQETQSSQSFGDLNQQSNLQHNKFDQDSELYQQSHHQGFEQQTQHQRFEQQSQHQGFEQQSQHQGFDQQSQHQGFEQQSQHQGYEQQSQHQGYEQQSQHQGFEQLSQHQGLEQQSQHQAVEQQSGISQNHYTQSQIGQLEFGSKSPSGVKGGRVQRPESADTEIKLEPRLLQVFGGGPYEGANTDDIYNNVTPKPSVTLPPINDDDPWLIREKPREIMMLHREPTTTPEPTTVTETTTGTTGAPGTFWGKLGSKITTTIDKAKEKARGIFG